MHIAGVGAKCIAYQVVASNIHCRISNRHAATVLLRLQQKKPRHLTIVRWTDIERPCQGCQG
jgi:hypothetical protein